MSDMLGLSRCRSIGGLVVEVVMRTSRALRGAGAQTTELPAAPVVATVRDDMGRVVARVRFKPCLQPHLPRSQASAGQPLLLVYERRQRHPAGDEAVVSWINAEGIGLLRFIQGRRQLVLPLRGLMPVSDAPVTPRSGSRGPSRSADLWMLVAALCLPHGFTADDLAAITGLSRVVVHRRMRELLALGLIAVDPRRHERAATYTVVMAPSGARLATFIEERWAEWRRGTGSADLRPTYRSFAATNEWEDMHAALQERNLACFPTSVTFFERGPDGAVYPRLQRSGLLPEVHLYVAADQAAALRSCIGSALLACPVREQSTLCILPRDHPVLLIVAHRRRLGGYQTAWPAGLAALDMWEHPDPRARNVAREAWTDWLAAVGQVGTPQQVGQPLP